MNTMHFPSFSASRWRLLPLGYRECCPLDSFLWTSSRTAVFHDSNCARVSASALRLLAQKLMYFCRPSSTSVRSDSTPMSTLNLCPFLSAARMMGLLNLRISTVHR